MKGKGPSDSCLWKNSPSGDLKDKREVEPRPREAGWKDLLRRPDTRGH